MPIFLIGCSKSKYAPVIQRQGDISNLTFHNELGDLRLNLLRLNPQIQLDWNYTLPAWELYSGPKSRLYSRILCDNWQKEGTEVYILSALFGWIRHTDILPMYDLAMGDGIPNYYKKVSNFWLESGSLDLVPDDSIDLLSKVYRRALNCASGPIRNQAIQTWHDNYGFHKGEWLNKELNLLK